MTYTINDTAIAAAETKANFFVGYVENKDICLLNPKGEIFQMKVADNLSDDYFVPGQQDKLCLVLENGCAISGKENLRVFLDSFKPHLEDGKTLSEAGIFTYNGGETSNPHFKKISNVAFDIG